MMTFFTVSIGLFCIACLATFLAAFPYGILAQQAGMVDRPDNFRKLHREPIPVGGGVVIFLVLTACLVALVLLHQRNGFEWSAYQEMPFLPFPLLRSLSLAVPFLLAIGLVDDKRGLAGPVKLLCQLAAATVIVAGSDLGTRVACFGCEADLSWCFYPLAVLAIVGLTNAVNLLDGADGMAVTTAFFMVLAAAAVALINGHLEFALLGIGLAGCLLGFFPHNWPSAKIYLGDSGSMFLGFVTGILLLHSASTSDGTFHFVGPMAVILIPMADSLMAVVRRLNAGRSIFVTDRGHVHHLLAMRFSPGWPVLIVLCPLITPGCAGAILGTYLHDDYYPLGAAMAVLTVAALADLFGRRELMILYGRIYGRFLRTFIHKEYMIRNGETYHVQGRGPWLEMWSRIIVMLKDCPCRKLKLDINIPFRNENFCGEWYNAPARKTNESADMDFSLFFTDGQHRIGVLRLSFDGHDRDRSELMNRVDRIFGLCEAFVSQCLTSDSWDGETLPLPGTMTVPTEKREAS